MADETTEEYALTGDLTGEALRQALIGTWELVSYSVEERDTACLVPAMGEARAEGLSLPQMAGLRSIWKERAGFLLTLMRIVQLCFRRLSLISGAFVLKEMPGLPRSKQPGYLNGSAPNRSVLFPSLTILPMLPRRGVICPTGLRTS